jgi:hypothetical protein
MLVVELAIVPHRFGYNFEVWFEREPLKIEALCQQGAVRANMEDASLTERHIGNNSCNRH